MQNSINKVKKFVTSRKRCLKWPFRPTLKEKKFCNRTIAIEEEICRTSFNKLIDIRTTMLDLRKGAMQDF